MRNMGRMDDFLGVIGRALATVAALPQAPNRAISTVAATPADADQALDPAARRLSGRLLRVDHVGEVCAQALYEGQAFGTDNPQLRMAFLTAAGEEGDHLAWTAQRLSEVGARPSLLNPFWYAASFALGVAASRRGDAVSLGFMAETERQVENHLEDHLRRLPVEDQRSRQVLEAMRRDEVSHAERARSAGGADLPLPARGAMRLMSKFMTATAERI